MSDTVKLIIEIPKWKYKSICEGVEASKIFGFLGADPDVYEAIYNGTPLDNVKAEIAEEICLTDNPYTKETKYTIEHLKLLEILDNIGNAESEKLADVGLLTQSLEDAIDCS